MKKSEYRDHQKKKRKEKKRARKNFPVRFLAKKIEMQFLIRANKMNNMLLKEKQTRNRKKKTHNPREQTNEQQMRKTRLA